MMTNQRLIVELQANESIQRKLATTDYLTGIFNRGEFIARSQAQIALVKRYGHPLGAMLIDLDHFKKVNDEYGHSAGDAVLCAFAVACQQQLRETDIFGRWGGEEFTILLPETESKDCLLIADRLRETVAQLAVTTEAGTVHITISIGVVVFEPLHGNIFQALSIADQALYLAKHKGRNCVVMNDQDPLLATSELR
jgi:diguanylate cyclase (GGDEF)-like protein